MKICLLNGSPKPKDSNSEEFLKIFQKYLEGQETELYRISNKGALTDEQYEKVQNCDAVVLAFPLYHYTLPSHVLRFLTVLEKKGFKNPNTRFYGIVNCGFDEGIQNTVAIAQMKFWCKAVGITWGQAIGFGGGEILVDVKKVPFGHGPKASLKKAYDVLAASVLNSSGGDDVYAQANFPQKMYYRMGAKRWYKKAEANGLTKEDVYKGCAPDHKIY